MKTSSYIELGLVPNKEYEMKVVIIEPLVKRNRRAIISFRGSKQFKIMVPKRDYIFWNRVKDEEILTLVYKQKTVDAENGPKVYGTLYVHAITRV